MLFQVIGSGQMTYFSVDDLLNRFKGIILWIIIKVMFFSSELREEATTQFNSRVVLIPGVFYGLNVFRGYQAIGQHYPDRRTIVRIDYVLGYLKFALIAICTGLFFFLLWKYLA
jgi:hypothetical protein